MRPTAIDRQLRIRGQFNAIVREYDSRELPYIAYLFEGGYAARKLSMRDKDGILIPTTSKTTLAKIEADIKRLYRGYRLERVIRFDGASKIDTYEDATFTPSLPKSWKE